MNDHAAAVWRDSIIAGTDLVAQLNSRMWQTFELGDFSRDQAKILVTVAKTAGFTDRDVANRLAMASSQLSRNISVLIKLGFITFIKHIDGRQRYLRLSPSGEDAAAKLSIARTAAFSRAMLTLPNEARSEIRRMGLTPGTGLAVTGNTHVRPASVADGLSAFQLLMRHQLTSQNDHRFPAYAAQLMAVMFNRWPPQPELAGYVAVDDTSEVVAFCLMVRGSTLDDDTSDDVEIMFAGPFVAPSYRSRGHGQMLLDRCVSTAREASYSHASTYIPVEKVGLSLLLQNNDFHRAPQTDNLNGVLDKRTWSIFSKTLA